MHACLVINVLWAVCVASSSTAVPVKENEDAIAGQYIVVFKENGEQLYAHSVVSHTRTKGKKTIALVEADDAMRAELERNPAVESIEVNRKISLVKPVQTELVAKNLPKTDVVSLKSLSGTGTCLQRQSFKEDYAWGSIRTSYRQLPDYFTDPYYYMYRGEGVDVYVLDTGIDINHVEFTIDRASHGVVSPNVESEGPTDFNGHGTHVAGTVAGNLLGLADQCNVISCKVLNANGEGSSYGTIYGINWVVQQVQNQKTQGKKPRAIINMSLGGSSYSDTYYQTIQGAVDEGISVIVAAGNDAENAGEHYPAAYDNTIAVAATNKSDNFATFSNYGGEVAIAAPGVSIWSAGSTNDPRCASITPENCLLMLSGTSMAAPHVTGVVARHLSSLTDQEFDLQTPLSISATLQESATQGQILYQNQAQAQTPNLLLYKECGKTALPTGTYTVRPTPAKSDAMSVRGQLGTRMLALFFILVLSGFSCNI